MYFNGVFATALISLLPHLSSAAPASVQLNEPGLIKRYVPGGCGVHIVQHQKPNPAVDPYTFDISLYDNIGNAIGGSQGRVGRSNTPINQFSELPYVLLVIAGNIDNDPVSFAYAGANWNSDTGPCSVGLYDSGSRQLDCGFTC